MNIEQLNEEITKLKKERAQKIIDELIELSHDELIIHCKIGGIYCELQIEEINPTDTGSIHIDVEEITKKRVDDNVKFLKDYKKKSKKEVK